MIRSRQGSTTSGTSFRNQNHHDAATPYIRNNVKIEKIIIQKPNYWHLCFAVCRKWLEFSQQFHLKQRFKSYNSTFHWKSGKRWKIKVWYWIQHANRFYEVESCPVELTELLHNMQTYLVTVWFADKHQLMNIVSIISLHSS